jgi:anhydro-N-acetylmuramic acid kinase
MSGTSLDAVDMAVLETNGETIAAFGPCGERKLSPELRALILEAIRQARNWTRGSPQPEIFAVVARRVAEDHLLAAREFMRANGLAPKDLDLVGFHGQTVLHERPAGGIPGRTVQLGDAALLAQGLGLPVAYDFRTADVAAGGEGAPLAPIYHAARARACGLTPPLAVLNLGGVANITLIGEDGELSAFDTGPANGMVDLWIQSRTGERFDLDGGYAGQGTVDEGVVGQLLSHPYFAAQPPKSLDRYDFSLDPAAGLSLADGAATLTAFTARSVERGLAWAPHPVKMLIVAGGGRRNRVMMRLIAERVGVKTVLAEDLGWRGDAIEAEAFAFLAARTLNDLPVSFPGTTGAPRPMVGGRIVNP